MANLYWVDWHGDSKLLDANEANPTADDGGFTNWLTSNHFVLVTAVGMGGACNKDTENASFKLQFSEDGGAWTDVGAATAISYNATTTLVDGAASVNRITTIDGDLTACSNGFEAGYEIEGVNLSTAFVVTKRFWTEMHWALNPANATPGSVYTFRVINVTNGNTPLSDSVLSTVTIFIDSDRRVIVV